MNRLSDRLVFQIYTLLVLLAAAIMSPLPHNLLALVLLLVMLFGTMRPLPPGLNVAFIVAVVFLTPLVLASLLDGLVMLPLTAVSMIAVVFILPVIYLLDDNLRQNARYIQTFVKGRKGRHVTRTYMSLLISALVIMLISPAVGKPVLFFTGVVFLLYLLGMLVWILLTIPRLPLTAPSVRKRVIAGTAGSVGLPVSSTSPAGLYCRLNPADPWLKVMPQTFFLNQGETMLDLSFTPPLAGPSLPQLQASAIDSRGFIQIDQLLEPLQLYIIPRAEYAGWLTRKYLERTQTGVMAAASLRPEAVMMPKRGVEYLDSRTYQPGDPLRNIDWKHTIKLHRLVVKEYVEAGEPAAVIAVNLSVADAEEADKLAFNLITVALTLARGGIPAALAAYNHQDVILGMPVTDPSEILRKALSLVKEITLVDFAERHLEPADIARIRRTITRLRQVESEPARRLIAMLDFEYRAIEDAAGKHPATLALAAATRRTPGPAVIFLVSPLNHDAEAVLVAAEKFSLRNFTMVPLSEPL